MIERDATAKVGRGKAAKESAQRHRSAQKTAMLLKLVSDPTRIQVLEMLAQGEWHIASLSEELKMSQPAVSHHLALLRHGGLISPRRQGKTKTYALTVVGSELARVVRGLIG
jgi:DNA-binding transcriptional ArsR family regulator